MDLIAEIFLTVAEMSRKSCAVILIVLAACLLMRRAPKKFSYAVWIAVGFRLVMPFSIPSPFSVFNLGQSSQVDAGPPYITYYGAAQAVDTYYTEAGEAAARLETSTGANASGILAAVWLAGLVLMLVVGAASYIRLRRKVRPAVRLDGCVYECGGVGTPFILGIFRPKIYVPFRLGDDELEYVVCHERCHLKRFDHVVKFISYVILAVHWFNPLVWLSFFMMTKYMEMSCDEKVISIMGDGIKKSYSMSLLSFGVNRRLSGPFSPSFAEAGIKGRVKHVLNFKKSKLWIIIAATLLCAAVIAGCSTDAGLETGTGGESLAQRLYDAKNTYIGDASRDGNLLNVMEIGEKIGEYTIELQTAEEPYEIIINFTESVSERRAAYIDGEMNNNAMVLLALIDNAGAVRWNYTVTGGDGLVERQLTVERADELVNGSIKDYGATFEKVGELLEMLSAGDAEAESGSQSNGLDGAGLEDAVTRAIIEENMGGDGDVTVEAHTTLLTEEHDGEITVYTVAMAINASLVDGNVVNEGGSDMPVAITFETGGGDYVVTEYWTPQDGSMYEESIREKFPSSIADEAMDTQRYVDELSMKCLEAANEYFGASSSEWSYPAS